MKPSEQDISVLIINIVNNIIQEWGLDATIDQNTHLVAELGFSSIDIIDLLATLETQLGRKLPYEQLLRSEGGDYRQELTVCELSSFVFQNFDVARIEPQAI